MIPYTMKKIDLELENQLAHGQVEHLETTEISEIRKILKKKTLKKVIASFATENQNMY